MLHSNNGFFLSCGKVTAELQLTCNLEASLVAKKFWENGNNPKNFDHVRIIATVACIVLKKKLCTNCGNGVQAEHLKI